MTTDAPTKPAIGLRGSRPRVLQLYSLCKPSGGDAAPFWAIQLWYQVLRFQSDDEDAQFVADRVGGVFGNFFVLIPGLDASEAERVREVLDQISREEHSRAGDPDHVLLLEDTKVPDKDSFFTWLKAVLTGDSIRIKIRGGQDPKDIAEILIARFFGNRPSKMRDLAHSLRHQAHQNNMSRSYDD